MTPTCRASFPELPVRRNVRRSPGRIVVTRPPNLATSPSTCSQAPGTTKSHPDTNDGMARQVTPSLPDRS